MVHYYSALVTLLTVLLQAAMMVNVGRARSKYGVKAPATSGEPGFERAFRVQMNTMESTLMFLPSLWIFAFYLSELGAGILGLVWLFGRVIYAISYQQDPQKRAAGFLTGSLAIVLLWIGALYGLVRALLID